MKVEYDPKCEELARWFLDERIRDDEDVLVAELAGVIQSAIEGWLEDQEAGAAGGKA